jgi:protoheme IX farnesyltransferase
MMQRLTAYYHLTKPGIVYGNLFHAAVGLFIAYGSGFDGWQSIGLLVGIAATIASACVANNILDRSIDSRMARTKRRALVTGDIPLSSAVLFGLVLLTLGVVVLMQMTNAITLILVLVAYVWYVWLYGWAKRHTWHSTLIGAVPGAIPIVAGYTAITDRLDLNALLLFIMLMCWQMPHFYAIALYREKEYRAAGLPVISTVHSRQSIHRHMVLYAAAYVLSFIGLATLGGLNMVAAAGMIVVGLWWCATIVRGGPDYSDAWARRVFKSSLLLTVALMAAAAETWLL